MADWLNELEQLTFSVMENLKEMTDQELLHFVEERERILDALKRDDADSSKDKHADFDGDTRRRIQQLLQYDGMIQARMQAMLSEYGLTFSKVQAAKKQKSAYDIEYTPDSLFFDKKK